MIRFVVLAAGESSRMGRNKLLIPLQGKPLLHWVVDALLSVSKDPVLVITGYEHQRIEDCLESYGSRISVVHNPDFCQGRSTSIRRALEIFNEPVSAVLITPGDVPLITAELVAALIAGYLESGSITFPLVQGRKGHPVIFPRESFDMLMNLSGDQTLNDYMLTHCEKLNPVEWTDDGCTMDADSPEDFSTLELRLGGIE